MNIVKMQINSNQPSLTLKSGTIVNQHIVAESEASLIDIRDETTKLTGIGCVAQDKDVKIASVSILPFPISRLTRFHPSFRFEDIH